MNKIFVLLKIIIMFNITTAVTAQDASNYTAKSTGGAISRIIADHFADIISIRDQGARCDGSSHPLSSYYGTLAAAQAVYPFATSLSSQVDWAALQSAINLAQSRGGATVFVPYGNCLIDASVSITQNGVHLVGGSHQTQLTFTAQTGDDFVVGYQASQVAHIKLADIYINHTQKHLAGSSGYSINAKNVAEMEVDNVVIDHGYNGIYLRRTNDIHLSHVNVNDHYSIGISLYSDPNAGERSDGFFFADVVANGFYNGQSGLILDGAVYSVRCYTCVLLQETNALIIQNSAHSSSGYPQFAWFYDLETDGQKNASVVINSGYRIQFIESDLSNTSGVSGQGNADGSTVQINADPYAATQQIRFLGGRVGNTRQSGFAITGGNEISIIGTTVSDTSKAGSNSSSAIYISGGNRILLQDSNVGTMTGNSTNCAYGIDVATSSVTNLLATNNNFQPCVSGDTHNVGGVTVHIISNLHSNGTYS